MGDDKYVMSTCPRCGLVVGKHTCPTTRPIGFIKPDTEGDKHNAEKA